MEKRARLWGRGGGAPGGYRRGEFWGCWGAVRASIPTKYYENKTVCVFFQGASDGTVKTSRNIARKSKNTEILNFSKNRFFKIQYFGIFRLSNYISAYFDGTIRRGLKKHAYCPIFIILAWN